MKLSPFVFQLFPRFSCLRRALSLSSLLLLLAPSRAASSDTSPGMPTTSKATRLPRPEPAPKSRE
jgi:hypothetical protein